MYTFMRLKVLHDITSHHNGEKSSAWLREWGGDSENENALRKD